MKASTVKIQALILRFAAVATLAIGSSVLAQPQDPRESPLLFDSTPDTLTSLLTVDALSERLSKELDSVSQAGFHRLENRWGEKSYRQLEIVIQEDEIAGPMSLAEFADSFSVAAKTHDKEALKTLFRLTETEYQAALSGDFTKRFVKALGSYKQILMHSYNLTDSQYNKLAVMAFGILGVETKFTGSLKYKGKEQLPGLVKMGKHLKQFSKILKSSNGNLQTAWEAASQSVDLNSRGGTQIKMIPAKIFQLFHLRRKDLDAPEWSAVATIGFLADSLAEIRTMVQNAQPQGQLLFINKDNIYDYIPFIYLGKVNLLKNGTANAAQEPYDQAIRRNMHFIGLFER
jgi:hypothetical protein